MHTARTLRVCALVTIATSALIAAAGASTAGKPLDDPLGATLAPNSLQTLQR
jgi:hypothetical protein